ncbi:acyl-CoA dehydrogenase [Cohnella endophytica]|uniref:Acyl-CoA dehydrogenase n=1 Tax=Cohnella endophytica TaxID=2419778 RepID=A0A494XPK8_9BACL|nr:acyl-CoA dehydrogenase family protein [Cohnella endophytica]RKP50069.1 acyl-CoA dehydrogenase [Cohnella endophytica]
MPYIPDNMARRIQADANERGQGDAIAPSIIAYMYEAKLFKLFVPRELGGAMLPLPEAVKVFEEASRIDGSFGWLATIGSGGGFFSATLPLEQSKLIFAPEKALVAGSGHPNGVAKPTEGGYLVTGQWKYCSGAPYASVFTANCRIEGTLGAEAVIRSFAFLPEQVNIIRDWNAFGLKATESHSIEVCNVFVPAERTFDIMSDPHYDDPIFKYPFMPFAQTSFAAVCLGICGHFLEEVRAFAESRRADWSIGRPERFATLLRTVEDQAIAFERTKEQFHGTMERTWVAFVENDGDMSEDHQREVSDVCQGVARSVLAYTHMLVPLLGMTVLMEDHPLNRIWRDLLTASQHSVLAPV